RGRHPDHARFRPVRGHQGKRLWPHARAVGLTRVRPAAGRLFPSARRIPSQPLPVRDRARPEVLEPVSPPLPPLLLKAVGPSTVLLESWLRFARAAARVLADHALPGDLPSCTAPTGRARDSPTSRLPSWAGFPVNPFHAGRRNGTTASRNAALFR